MHIPKKSELTFDALLNNPNILNRLVTSKFFS